MGLKKPIFQSGKKFASGVGTLNNNTLIVNNLSFTPSKVIITLTGKRLGYAYASTAVISNNNDLYDKPSEKTGSVMAEYDHGTYGVSTNISNTGIIPNGFKFTPSSVTSNEVNWYAFE